MTLPFIALLGQQKPILLGGFHTLRNDTLLEAFT